MFVVVVILRKCVSYLVSALYCFSISLFFPFYGGNKSNKYRWLWVLSMLAILHYLIYPTKYIQNSLICFCATVKIWKFAYIGITHLHKRVFFPAFFFYVRIFLCFTVINQILFEFIAYLKMILWVCFKMMSLMYLT